MDKRMAIVSLLEHSVAIPDAAKIDILKKLPALPDDKITALYGFLTTEKAFVSQHADTIAENVKQLLTSFGN